MLVAALDQGNRRTSLSELSRLLGVPASTVHQALERPRSIGVVRGGPGGLRVLDPRRLEILWAGRRDLEADIVYSTRVSLPIKEIEARLPPSAIPTAYTAFIRHQGVNLVADYDQVVTYGSVEDFRRRFPPRKGHPNLIVLEPDPWLPRYGSVAPRCQVYVDLFNLPSWQAPRFLEALDRDLLLDVA
jgi:IclR helix-turn-helix domain